VTDQDAIEKNVDLAGRPGRRLTVLLSVRHHAGHHSLANELVRHARKQGVAGVTILEGTTGFGSSGSLHETHVLRDDAPLSFIVVDAPERIDTFLEATADLLEDVVVVTDDVTIHGR
jgi:PII-like signaling protein